MHTEQETQTETVKWKFHPRVFSSLGSELVTNDLVALVELVKNAYDAMAKEVHIRFRTDEETGEQLIEVRDDGEGMDKKTLETVWFVVGTPFRTKNARVGRGQGRRRVTGEKGLGRLSAARLGRRLRMYTMIEGGDCVRVDVDWVNLARAKTLDGCAAKLRVVAPPKLLGKHGTILRISKLRRPWAFDEESDEGTLEQELSRFVPPFGGKKDLRIFLTKPGSEEAEVEISPPKLLDNPLYAVKGNVDDRGEAQLEYVYGDDERPRRLRGTMNLQDAEPQLWEDSKPRGGKHRKRTNCGPFRFELRVWDLDRDAVLGLAERFKLDRKISAVRKLVSESPFSGIAVYRDGILVLPKVTGKRRLAGAAGRDWLGLDARRVSRVGARISASQIVGFVDISAEANRALRDTSDRERLVDNDASRQFRDFLYRILRFLEERRANDRTKPGYTEPPMKDLLEALRSPGLQQKLDDLEKRGGGWKEIREAVEEYGHGLKDTAEQIEKRFYYYSRLATIGSLAALLQHEVGSKVAVLGEFLSRLHELEAGTLPPAISRRSEAVSLAVRSLERLADKFAPLAVRQSATRRRTCVLETEFDDICELRSGDIERLGVDVKMRSHSKSTVAVDPGEVAGILDNLLTNSLYWLSKVEAGTRKIVVEVHRNRGGDRVGIRFHDSGPGIADGDEERIFWPGVTNKETGLGMGLTVASEIVASHGGRMHLIKPGDIGGASFGFDLPLIKESQR